MKIDYLDAIRFCMVNLEFPQSLTCSVVCSYIVVDVMSFKQEYLTESYFKLLLSAIHLFMLLSYLSLLQDNQ